TERRSIERDLSSQPRNRTTGTDRGAQNFEIHPQGSQEAPKFGQFVNAWEIWTFDPGFGDHPAVIISAQNRTERKPLLEIVLCSSHRATRAPNAGEVVLDSSDGLDWETLCKCDLIFSVERELLHTPRGLVTTARRREIVRAIIASHGWNQL